ncbi:type I glyceraldehyde-3-phosphate dehydrogenase [Candidatus Babeliales bacterium]|nr:type I glyceraldehyde-3-phosphate dehydrogenase [Candidatus Babeliales bacterium]
MSINLAINGFGRIGRTFLRTIMCDSQARSKLNVVGINVGPAPVANLDLLFKYDSIMGTYQGQVSYADHKLVIDGHEITIISESEPEALPWKRLNIDWVVEASGHFTTREQAQRHPLPENGKILITAPSKDVDITIIPGVNSSAYNASKHRLVSLGSCTTNCFAPLVKVINDNFTLVQGMMTTTHAYTASQNLLDNEHKDARRARAAAANMVPAATGASKVITQIFPELEGKILATSLRVPLPIMSLVDFTFVTQETLPAEKINEAFKTASSGSLKNIIEYCDKPLVSSDFIGNPHSAIFDSLLTNSTGSMHKIFAWYDNEFGYSSRLKEFLLHNS